MVRDFGALAANSHSNLVVLGLSLVGGVEVGREGLEFGGAGVYEFK